jgi:hypothetical protein
MKTKQRRITLTLGVAAGGLLATAFLPVAAAFADEYDFTPDTTTFDPTQVEGYPPLFNEVTGSEDWSISDLTTDTVKFQDAFLIGTDTQTTIGSFTNDDYLTSITTEEIGSPGDYFVVPGPAQFDLANFGGGFENEWIDIPSGPDSGISDLLITPFGDFPLFGTAFADLATAIG